MGSSASKFSISCTGYERRPPESTREKKHRRRHRRHRSRDKDNTLRNDEEHSDSYSSDSSEYSSSEDDSRGRRRRRHRRKKRDTAGADGSTGAAATTSSSSVGASSGTASSSSKSKKKKKHRRRRSGGGRRSSNSSEDEATSEQKEGFSPDSDSGSSASGGSRKNSVSSSSKKKEETAKLAVNDSAAAKGNENKDSPRSKSKNSKRLAPQASFNVPTVEDDAAKVKRSASYPKIEVIPSPRSKKAAPPVPPISTLSIIATDDAPVQRQNSNRASENKKASSSDSDDDYEESSEAEADVAEDSQYAEVSTVSQYSQYSEAGVGDDYGDEYLGDPEDVRAPAEPDLFDQFFNNDGGKEDDIFKKQGTLSKTNSFMAPAPLAKVGSFMSQNGEAPHSPLIDSTAATATTPGRPANAKGNFLTVDDQPGIEGPPVSEEFRPLSRLNIQIEDVDAERSREEAEAEAAEAKLRQQQEQAEQQRAAAQKAAAAAAPAPVTATAPAPPSVAAPAAPVGEPPAEGPVQGEATRVTRQPSEVETPKQKQLRMRRIVANELLSTEETYVYRLQTLVDVFIVPLQESMKTDHPLVTAQELETLFSNIQTIAQLNGHFLDEVRARVLSPEELQELNERKEAANNPASPKVTRRPTLALSPRDKYVYEPVSLGDCVLAFAPFLRLYSIYVGNMEAANNFLYRTLNYGGSKDIKTSKRHTQLSEFLHKAEYDGRCEGQNLQSFLILPIQRIPRYKLMLQELLKYTDGDVPLPIGDQVAVPAPPSPTDSPRKLADKSEYQNINDSLAAIENVANSINQAMREQQDNAQVLAIQDQFYGDVKFVSPGRRLLKQGPLLKVSRRSDKDYEFFLFNDLLVYATRRLGPQGFKFSKQFEAPIDESFRINLNMTYANLESGMTRFKIHTAAKSFVVVAKNEGDKSTWVSAFQQAIDQQKSSQKYKHTSYTPREAPIFEQYKSGAACRVCNQSVGLLNRRHCKNCGRVVHSQCSSTKMILPGTYSKDLKDAKNVCDVCVAEIKARRVEEILQQPDMARANTLDSVDPGFEAPISPTNLLAQRMSSAPVTAHYLAVVRAGSAENSVNSSDYTPSIQEPNSASINDAPAPAPQPHAPVPPPIPARPSIKLLAPTKPASEVPTPPPHSPVPAAPGPTSSSPATISIPIFIPISPPASASPRDHSGDVATPKPADPPAEPAPVPAVSAEATAPQPEPEAEPVQESQPQPESVPEPAAEVAPVPVAEEPVTESQPAETAVAAEEEAKDQVTEPAAATSEAEMTWNLADRPVSGVLSDRVPFTIDKQESDEEEDPSSFLPPLKFPSLLKSAQMSYDSAEYEHNSSLRKSLNMAELEGMISPRKKYEDRRPSSLAVDHSRVKADGSTTEAPVVVSVAVDMSASVSEQPSEQPSDAVATEEKGGAPDTKTTPKSLVAPNSGAPEVSVSQLSSAPSTDSINNEKIGSGYQAASSGAASDATASGPSSVRSNAPDIPPPNPSPTPLSPEVAAALPRVPSVTPRALPRAREKVVRMEGDDPTSSSGETFGLRARSKTFTDLPRSRVELPAPPKLGRTLSNTSLGSDLSARDARPGSSTNLGDVHASGAMTERSRAVSTVMLPSAPNVNSLLKNVGKSMSTRNLGGSSFALPSFPDLPATLAAKPKQGIDRPLSSLSLRSIETITPRSPLDTPNPDEQKVPASPFSIHNIPNIPALPRVTTPLSAGTPPSITRAATTSSPSPMKDLKSFVPSLPPMPVIPNFSRPAYAGRAASMFVMGGGTNSMSDYTPSSADSRQQQQSFAELSGPSPGPAPSPVPPEAAAERPPMAARSLSTERAKSSALPPVSEAFSDASEVPPPIPPRMPAEEAQSEASRSRVRAKSAPRASGSKKKKKKSRPPQQFRAADGTSATTSSDDTSSAAASSAAGVATPRAQRKKQARKLKRKQSRLPPPPPPRPAESGGSAPSESS